MKLIKEPITQFILIGALLFFSYQSFNNYLNRDNNIIVITKEEINLLEESWKLRWNRPPTPMEKEGIIRQQIREKVLYRTAIEMGLDKEDLVIRRRMVQKVEFLGADLIRPPQPSESDLIKYYEENKDNYKLPETLSFTQIFFDPDKRGDATLEDAYEAIQQLSKKAPEQIDLSGYGDPFMLANQYKDETELEIRKLFGRSFKDEVFQLEPGKWYGPVLSGYGTHLVFVQEKVSNEVPPFNEVREYVLADWMEDKKEELEQRYIDGLLARYEVIVEDNK